MTRVISLYLLMAQLLLIPVLLVPDQLTAVPLLFYLLLPQSSIYSRSMHHQQLWMATSWRSNKRSTIKPFGLMPCMSSWTDHLVVSHNHLLNLTPLVIIALLSFYLTCVFTQMMYFGCYSYFCTFIASACMFLDDTYVVCFTLLYLSQCLCIFLDVMIFIIHMLALNLISHPICAKFGYTFFFL